MRVRVDTPHILVPENGHLNTPYYKMTFELQDGKIKIKMAKV